MSLGHYLFSFEGRINRAKQWAILLVGLVHGILLGIAFNLTVGFVTVVDLIEGKTNITAVVATTQAKEFAIVYCVLFVIGLYIGLAVMTKRLHDRDKSAWWLLVYFVLPFVLQIPGYLALPASMAHVMDAIHAVQQHLPPPAPMAEPPLVILSRGAGLLISLWVFIELYFFRGTAGENRFGPDPLA